MFNVPLIVELPPSAMLEITRTKRIFAYIDSDSPYSFRSQGDYQRVAALVAELRVPVHPREKGREHGCWWSTLKFHPLDLYQISNSVTWSWPKQQTEFPGHIPAAAPGHVLRKNRLKWTFLIPEMKLWSILSLHLSHSKLEWAELVGQVCAPKEREGQEPLEATWKLCGVAESAVGWFSFVELRIRHMLAIFYFML